MKLKPPIPKLEARKIIEESCNEIPKAELNIKGEKIFRRLIQTDDFVYAKKILIFLSENNTEVNTKKIIRFADGRGKSVFLPKYYSSQKKFKKLQFTSFNELVLNDEGYYEPKFGFDDDFSDLDMIIVPAVAVSVLGQRTGYDGGEFDRLLKKTYAPKYVLAREFQIFRELETGRKDIRIDRIVTERRILDIRNRYYF